MGVGAVHLRVEPVRGGNVPLRFSALYAVVINHQTGERLKIELVDLPFTGAQLPRPGSPGEINGELLRLCAALSGGSPILRRINQEPASAGAGP